MENREKQENLNIIQATISLHKTTIPFANTTIGIELYSQKNRKIENYF